MSYKDRQDDSKKKTSGIRLGTYVTLYNGTQGIVVESDRGYTTVKELQYVKEFESTVSMPTSQVRRLVNK